MAKSVFFHDDIAIILFAGDRADGNLVHAFAGCDPYVFGAGCNAPDMSGMLLVGALVQVERLYRFLVFVSVIEMALA